MGHEVQISRPCPERGRDLPCPSPFPNGAAFDAKGNLLVADSAAGRIFSVTPQGAVSTWSQDAELAGWTTCNAPLPFPIGANGIVFTPTAAYVSNTSRGSILKIAVDASGNAAPSASS